MNPKPMAAIYARLSEEDRDKVNCTEASESILNQVMLLRQYADSNGWEVYKCYTDDDWTGADRNRPAFNLLLQDAERGKFNIVLCKTQSRFTRELEMVEKYIHGLFIQWGIRFVGVVDNADTSVKGNKKARQINGLVNEWYLEDMSENIRAVLTTRRKEGYYIGSTPLYGYRKDPERKGHLIVDPEAAEVVKRVFHAFAAGMGKTAIARMLNEEDIPNPTEYKRQKGMAYKIPSHKTGTLWKYYTIAAMLRNEMYIGNLVQGRYGSVSYKTKKNKPIPKDQWIRVEHTHDPIIDRELWNTVQKMQKERVKPFSTGEVGIFAGKVRCKQCGCVMRSGKGRGRRYLRCSTRYVARDACSGAFIYVDKLEQMLLEEWKTIREQYMNEKGLEAEIRLFPSGKDNISYWKSHIRQQEKKISQLDQAMKNLYLDKVKGEIEVESFQILLRELMGDKQRAQTVLDTSREKIKQLKLPKEGQRGGKEIIEEYVNTKHVNRSFVEHLIDYVEVSRCDPATGMVTVDIYWNF